MAEEAQKDQAEAGKIKNTEVVLERMEELEKDLSKGDLGFGQSMQDTGRQGHDTNEVQGGGGSEQNLVQDNLENLPTTPSSILTGGHVPIVEMGLVPFTPSNKYNAAFLEDICFDPNTKSIVWRTDNTLKV